MEVLVTGGNGFVGRHLAAALVHRGDTVRVLALPDEDSDALERLGVAVHRGDICRLETLRAPMRDVDAVVHLAAMMHVWRPLADYRAVNVRGTHNVCRAALDASVTRVVHMSSSSVYGMAWNSPVHECFPLAPYPDPYPTSKAEADRLVRRMAADHGLPAIVVRPDQIFGPGDRLHFGATADRLRARRGVVVGRGNNAIPLVYVSDAVQGLLLALDRGTATGQAYNISAETPLTQEEFLSAIACAIGVPPPRIHVPYRALYAAACAAERASALRPGDHRPTITRLGVAFLGTDVHYSIEKAREQLGYRPAVTVREGVDIAAAWYTGTVSPTSPTVSPAISSAV
jgi:nucleoside-diphosphate-sugar epimerase